MSCDYFGDQSGMMVVGRNEVILFHKSQWNNRWNCASWYGQVCVLKRGGFSILIIGFIYLIFCGIYTTLTLKLLITDF